jgi:hypothetical protein
VTDDAGRPARILADSDLLAGEWLASEEQSMKTMCSRRDGQ